ncbi:hypothetical protein [Allosphingosinicella flava]|uniref:hypothetical protein n=1 Tax=Allosphingosinicella flava TaxID=2771430 RepID=UPI001A9C52F9|nr:hypothetical protein [Sphingosinicella flava]
MAASENEFLHVGDVETDPETWIPYGPYHDDPAAGRLMRCGIFLEAAADLYFGAQGLVSQAMNTKDIRPQELTQLMGATPRLSAAEIDERNAYARAGKALYERAKEPAQSLSDYGKKPGYDVEDFHDDFRWGRMSADALIRGGAALQSMASNRADCFGLPEVAPLKARLEARLAKPVPGMERPASARIQMGRMPRPLHAYLYKPEAYRYLTCASIAYVAGTERFGMMPNPGAPLPEASNVILNLAQAKLDSAQAGEREAHRKASWDTFEAGLKRMGIKSQAEKDSYKYSFRVAVDAVTPLVKEGLAADLMAEPVLQCAGLPSMAPFVTGKGVPTSVAPAASLEKPEGFRSWPDRKTGYLANPVAFRNMFCSAMIYAAYTNGAAEDVWFAPPSRRDEFWSSGDGDAPRHDEDAAERAAVKAVVYKLYDAGQIDKEAKDGGKWFFSKYAGDYTLATYAANNILKDRQGVEAMTHDTARCLALPDVAPIADAIEAKVSAWDER